MAIGHNRYSTSGGAEGHFHQPFVNKKKTLAFAHNGNLPTYDKLLAFLKKNNVSVENLNDSGMMSAAIDWHMGQGLSIEQAISQSYPLFQGVFSAVAMTNNKLVAFRDPFGIRPLSVGKTESGYIISSETCAFETIGAEYIRDVQPGELVAIDDHGLTSLQIVKGEQKLDIFEFVYFARPDSILLGKSVNSVRENFGRELAKECRIDGDIVVPVPDSSVPAALGYSKQSGIPLDIALVKNRYINRTFIRPTRELRKRDLMMKLNPVIDSLKGKRVILVDDSIVRGSTMKQVVSMLRGVGVKEIHLVISSPPVKFPDFYGINTPNQEDLIASKLSVEQINKFLGSDSLQYLTFDGMIKATELPKSVFCTSCFNGEYPISIGARADGIQYVDSRPVTRSIKSAKSKVKDHAEVLA